MASMYLNYFTKDESFPFFINYGYHGEEGMFMHGHEDFSELVIVLDGSATHIVNDESYTINKGDVFVIGRGVEHAYADADNLEICNVMFSTSLLLSDNHDIKKNAGFHSIFVLEPHITKAQGFTSKLKLYREDFNNVKALLDKMVKEYKDDLPGRKTLLLASFMELVVMLSRLYSKTKPEYDERNIDIIATAAAYMEERFTEDICIDDLLQLTHYSQRHFIRLFSIIYNMPPQKYLTKIRMNHAKMLLSETNLTVTEIAMKCGFSDPNYFTRIFGKTTGISPLAFRKQEN